MSLTIRKRHIFSDFPRPKGQIGRKKKVTGAGAEALCPPSHGISINSHYL